MVKLEERAKVILNGEETGALLGPTYSLEAPQEKLKSKTPWKSRFLTEWLIVIEWMGETNQNYRIFYDINMPAHDAENRGPDVLVTSKN